MKLGWFWFTPAPDGFDLIVRDQGADNGEIVLDLGVRGEDFKKFVDEVLTEGLDSLKPKEEPLPEATAEDWADEEPVEEEEPKEEKKSWF